MLCLISETVFLAYSIEHEIDKCKKALRPKWHKRCYERVGVYNPKIMLNALKHMPDTITVNGYKAHTDSARYVIFRKSLVCVKCGLVGTILALEKFKSNRIPTYHFNLYAVDSNTGYEVMMTKDHIVPKSKGGSNALKNFQTMCRRCNELKGNKYDA